MLRLSVLAFLWILLTLPSCESHCCHGDVRLVNGYTPNEERVEVCLSNQWKTVCTNFWGSTVVGVVCVQLGFMRENAQILTYGSFGRGSGSILDYVACSGTAMELIECSLFENYSSYCTHSQDTGLRCGMCSNVEKQAVTCQTGAVRLQDGNGHGQGRIEMCKNGVWGTVCDNSWDSQDAKVVCRQLGFSSSNAQALQSAYYGSGSGLIHIDNVMCSGNESSLFDCPHSIHHNCGHIKDASVSCQTDLICKDGDIRLMNGNSYAGRVEICFNETWGTICDNGWQSQSANVTCRQLGLTGYSYWYNWNVYGITSGDIHLTNVNCNGNEDSLLECSYSHETQSCSHIEDIEVYCHTTRTPNGELHLTGGLTQYERVVKIFISGTWQHICFDDWNDPDARVVCRQMGYLSTFTNVAAYGVELHNNVSSNKTQMLLRNVSCSGIESQLTSCCATETYLLYCSSQKYAGVRCGQCIEESLRLVNRPTQYEGRLEICLGGGWGTICDNGFGTNNAIVACRQLGFSTVEGSISQCCGFYGKGTTLPVAMANVGCTSTENKLSQCTYLNAHNHNCGHSQDVGVFCQISPGMPQGLKNRSTIPTAGTHLSSKTEVNTNRTLHPQRKEASTNL